MAAKEHSTQEEPAEVPPAQMGHDEWAPSRSKASAAQEPPGPRIRSADRNSQRSLVLHENVQDVFFTFAFLPQGQHPQRFFTFSST